MLMCSAQNQTRPENSRSNPIQIQDYNQNIDRNWATVESTRKVRQPSVITRIDIMLAGMLCWRALLWRYTPTKLVAGKQTAIVILLRDNHKDRTHLLACLDVGGLVGVATANTSVPTTRAARLPWRPVPNSAVPLRDPTIPSMLLIIGWVVPSLESRDWGTSYIGCYDTVANLSPAYVMTDPSHAGWVSLYGT